jgi:hypothetical protein
VKETIISRETTNAGKLGSLQKFRDSLKANSGDMPNLEGNRTQFDALVGTAQELSTRQAALIAEKQEVSQQLRTALDEAERLGTVLRLAVKQQFGIRAEKLAEFHLQPFRGRKKATVAVKTPPTDGAPLPAEPTTK